MNNLKIDEKWKTIANQYKCPHCGKKFSRMGICTHIWRMHSDGKTHDPNIGYKNTINQRVIWNKGLSKRSDARINKSALRSSKTMKKKIAAGEYIPYVLNDEQRLEASKRMSRHNPGGKCKWYVVNNIKVQGLWEYNIALILNKSKIIWQRPGQFKFLKNNKKSHYTPDFYLPSYDTYLEIKGFWWGEDRNKMLQFQKQYPDMKIKIIEKDSYTKIISEDITIHDLMVS